MAPRGDINLTITGDSRDWNRTLNRAEGRAKKSTGRMSGMFGQMGRSMTAGATTFAKGITGPFAALATGTAVIAAGKRMMDFDDNLLTLSMNAGLSTAAMMKLKDEIVQTGYDARIPRDEILAAFSDIVDKTGDFKFARESILGVGKATTAMGAEVEDVSRLASAASINLQMTGREISDFFNVIATQGNKGSFVFRDLANQAERLLSAGGRIGITKANFAEFGAFVQEARPGFGSAEETSTAISNIATRLKTQRKAVEDMLGYSIFDDQGKIKNFEKTITDLVKKSGGDIAKLYTIFQESSIAFTGLLSDYQKFGELRGFERLIAEGEQGTFLMDAFSRRVNQAKYNLRNLFAVGWEATDTALAPFIENLGESLSKLTADPQRLKELRSELEAIGEAAELVAKGLVKSAAGWGMLIKMFRDDAKSLKDENDKYGPLVKAFNRLPQNEKKSIVERGRAEGLAFRSILTQWDKGRRKKIAAVAGDYDQPLHEGVVNNIELTVNVDHNGRVIANSNNGQNTRLSVRTKGRGSLSGIED